MSRPVLTRYEKRLLINQFVGNYRDAVQHFSQGEEVNTLIFSSGNAMALSEKVEQLLTSPHLYSKLSIAASDTWERLQLSAKWGDIVNHWLEDTPENLQWLSSNSLAAQSRSELTSLKR